jgi:hypothetical protein
MCPFYALNPLRGGASKGSGAWILPCWCGTITHVPHSRDALSRAKPRRGYGVKTQRTEKTIGYWRLGLGVVRPMRAGLPAALEKAGISFVTTEPAPTMTRSPKVTPLRIMERAPRISLSKQNRPVCGSRLVSAHGLIQRASICTAFPEESCRQG